MQRGDALSGQQSLTEWQTVAQELRLRLEEGIRNGASWDGGEFEAFSLTAFRLQYHANSVYRAWCSALGWTPEDAMQLNDASRIPFLPVEAFKWGDVWTQGAEEEAEPLVFRTSGTTGDTGRRGIHTVRTPRLYQLSARSGFARVYGPAGAVGAVVLGLLPGYLERQDSSLVHMVQDLRAAGWSLPDESPSDGFYLDDTEGLFDAVDRTLEAGRTPVLIGVTWALVDAADAWCSSGRGALSDRVCLVETGGMKGRREEWVKARVHDHLKQAFGCRTIYGEYGMTELLSQAWSKGAGTFGLPPWMRIRIRRTDDPFSEAAVGSTGRLDIVDLANLGSCCFLSTQDLVRPISTSSEPQFEVLGRFDHAEVRGCNLMVE